MTKELDRRFRHVGRIKRSWGTTHKPTIRAMEQMMDGLFARGRLDILRSIQDRTYTPLEVYDAWRVNELERLPTAATLAPLKESMEKWIAKKECSRAHRLSLSQSLRHLLSKRSGSAIGELPKLLSDLRERQQGKHPRSFNLARAAVQAFVKSTLKRSHPIYAAITDIEPLPVKAIRGKHPLTPVEFDVLREKLPMLSARAAYAMFYTGMGPNEYWGKWEDKNAYIHIEGTKRAGRVRDIPRTFAVSEPEVSYVTFRKHLKAASDGTVTPYDLRRSFANLMEAAGIPRIRRKAYMGHTSGDITDRYERHEVAAYLVDDAEKIRLLVSAKESQVLKLVAEG